MSRPVIVLCYARSGGTILNKCLSSHSKAVVMSEVNPLGGGSGKVIEGRILNNVKSQSKAWYSIDLEQRLFSNQITELNEICKSLGKQLIVRDWTVVDFEAIEENQFDPKNCFSIIEELRHLNPIVIGFVRNAIDVWISRGQPQLNDFFCAYNNYVESLLKLEIPIFKFETFTKTPESVLRKMFIIMELPYENTINTAPNFENVNGDIQRGSKSRGEKSFEIKPLTRQIIPFTTIKSLHSNNLMKKSNLKLDYTVNYFDEVSYFVYLLKRIGQFYYRYKSRVVG